MGAHDAEVDHEGAQHVAQVAVDHRLLAVLAGHGRAPGTQAEHRSVPTHEQPSSQAWLSVQPQAIHMRPKSSRSARPFLVRRSTLRPPVAAGDLPLEQTFAQQTTDGAAKKGDRNIPLHYAAMRAPRRDPVLDQRQIAGAQRADLGDGEGVVVHHRLRSSR
ncbi:MAG: hypothetical protein WDM81_13765 [Rhizomicrobium sp.]